MTPYELNEITNYAPDQRKHRCSYFVRLRTNELTPRQFPQVRGLLRYFV
jgi:hypothetical protein